MKLSSFTPRSVSPALLAAALALPGCGGGGSSGVFVNQRNVSFDTGGQSALESLGVEV